MPVMRNLRVAVRMLLRQPLFAVTAILSIAVGIGANTAIFTAVNQLLLARPGGVADHARIVDIGRTRNGEGFDTVGYQTYLDVRDRAHGFAGIVGYTLEPRPMSLARDGSAEIAVQPIRNTKAVCGIPWMSPPSFSRSARNHFQCPPSS
mgnify:CR=1 FL=1